MNEQLRFVEGDVVARPDLDSGSIANSAGSSSGRVPAPVANPNVFVPPNVANVGTLQLNVAQPSGPHVGDDELTLAKPPARREPHHRISHGQYGVLFRSRPVRLDQRRGRRPEGATGHGDLPQSRELDRHPTTGCLGPRRRFFVYITEQNVMAFVDQLCDAVGIAEFGGPKAGRS